jgi:two-component system, NarL family, response regulator NreC
MSEMIRVLIADDHAVLRAGLRMLLDAEADMEVIGEAEDGSDALQKVMELKPDVVLMDVTMPHMNGLEALHKMVEKAPESRVLFLTMHNDEGYLRSALAAGGSGYVLKQSADSVLLSAIRAVHQGGTYLHPEHTQVLLDRTREQEETAQHPAEDSSELLGRLSSREQEVLRLIAMGYTNKQAADQLFLSVKTVETYKARLMVKLDLHSRAELVCFALEHGLMTE